MRARVLLLATLAACNLPYPANVGPTDAPQATIDSLPGAPDAMVDAMPLPDAAPGTLGLDVANARFFLRVGGGMASIGITLSRGAGVDGDVTVTVDSPPSMVSFDALTIPAGSTTGTLVAHALTNAAEIGEFNLTVKAVSGAAMATDSLDLDVIGHVGTLDPHFGLNGMAQIGTTADAFTPVAVFAQGDNVVVVMTVSNAGLTTKFLAYRLLVDGSQDSTFGVAGASTYDFTQIAITGGLQLAATVQSDGKIVLAGSGTGPGSNANDPFVARITVDGAIDSSLGPKRSDATSADDHVNSVVIDTVHPGQILLGGGTGATDAAEDSAIMRLTTSGDLDTSFATQGRAVTPHITPVDHVDSMVIVPSGPVGLSHIDGTSPAFAIYSISATGGLGAYGAAFGGSHSPSWPNSIGDTVGSQFLAWGHNGTTSLGVGSVFAVWQCTDNGSDGASCGYYESTQGARAQDVVSVVAIPDGSGYLAIGDDRDSSAPGTNDYQVDTILLAPNLAPMAVGTNGIVQDTSDHFQPVATVAHDDHRYDVLGFINPGGTPTVGVRRYFW
jgi:uncharacterized delta-60 repeat protein